MPIDGPTVVLGPAEDAGIVHLGTCEGERYGVVIAHESHNHPSQVVPFEGAATGVGGIVRDVLCMGAEVIGVADPLRFGRLDDPHCRYVAQSVVDGIGAYGNAIGVPNLAGDVYFDESFDDNCWSTSSRSASSKNARSSTRTRRRTRSAATSCSSAKRPIAAASAARRFRRSRSTTPMPKRTRAPYKFPIRFSRT